MSGIETLTILFTDLAGSTSLRVRLGEETADDVRAAHDALVARAIRTNGGRVVKHTGDGAMAVFGGASEALAAAVGIQQAIDRLSRERDDPLGVRIGISAGDVSVEGEDCFGIPVVEAQRLESAAQPGQILCSSLVKALARGRGGFELRSVGALDLKGLEGPLDAEEVVWAPAAADDAPMPPLLDRVVDRFAGRTAELATIAQHWVAVRSGATRVVLLAGEPGIGKTTLASRAAREAHAEGATVLAGRCDELVSSAYQPFAEALRWPVEIGRCPDLGHHTRELARLAPTLGPVTSLGDPEVERQHLFEAITAWLSASSPVVLVLDDLHWADAATILLLRHITSISPVPGLLVLGTYRDTDVDRQHPLAAALAELRVRGAVDRVALGGLDLDAVRELVAGSMKGSDGDPAALSTALLDQTDGNPFFVGEILQHLSAVGTAASIDTAGDVILPEGVRDVVGKRLSSLPEPTQRLLSTAAVIGAEFELGLVARVAGVDEDGALDDLDAAVDARLLAERGVGRFAFSHALVRSTLYQELSATRRARAHRRVAEAIEATGPVDDRAAELAHHWAATGSAEGATRSARHAEAAAGAEVARAAPDEAARWYRFALEALDGSEPDDEVRIAIALAEVAAGAFLDGHRELVHDAARRARDIDDAVAMARALLVSGRNGFAQGVEDPDPVKVELIGEVLGLLGDDEPALRARLLAELSVELIYAGETERRHAAIDEARSLLAEVADPQDRAALAFRLGLGRRFLRVTASDLRHELTLIHGAGDSHMPIAAEIGLATHSFLLELAVGERGTAEVHARRLSEIAKQTRHPRAEALRLMTGSVLDVLAGRLAEMERVLAELDAGASAQALGQYANALRLQLVQETFGLGAASDAVLVTLAGEEGPHSVVHAVAVAALSEAGRADEATALLDPAAARDFEDLYDDAVIPIRLGLWALGAARLRHPSSAALYRMHLVDPELHHVTGGWYGGSRKHHLALLAEALDQPSEAAAWFDGAIEAHERIDSPPWIARSLVEAARFHLARGDSAHARAFVDRALGITKELGLSATERRAEEVLVVIAP